MSCPGIFECKFWDHGKLKAKGHQFWDVDSQIHQVVTDNNSRDAQLEIDILFVSFQIEMYFGIERSAKKTFGAN